MHVKRWRGHRVNPNPNPLTRVFGEIGAASRLESSGHAHSFNGGSLDLYIYQDRLGLGLGLGD